MRALNTLMIAAMRGLAARYFPSSGRVVLSLDPSLEEDAALIDEATCWTLSPACVGRSRRIVLASKTEMIFEFEHLRDATEFTLLFG